MKRLRPLMPKFLECSVLLLVTALAPAGARADVGVQVGLHAGVALSKDVDPYVGSEGAPLWDRFGNPRGASADIGPTEFAP
jgi:hypothetical protein